jgi:hypothetical protein
MIEKSLHDSTVDRSYVQRVVVMHKFISPPQKRSCGAAHDHLWSYLVSLRIDDRPINLTTLEHRRYQ